MQFAENSIAQRRFKEQWHVLAEAAKHPIAPLALWFGLEASCPVAQFVPGGFLIAYVNRSPNASTQPQQDTQ